jgi:hypothetical protein
MNDKHIIFLPNIPAKRYSFDQSLWIETVSAIPMEHRRCA